MILLTYQYEFLLIERPQLLYSARVGVSTKVFTDLYKKKLGPLLEMTSRLVNLV
ncbi:hypothetical protein NLX69_07185 [Rossellomorea sp. BNER]|nr:hypothetical protein [Rossellomorea sp. BNER]